MVRVSYKNEGKNPLRRVLMHRPELEAAWDSMHRTFNDTALLPAELLEEVRATLAHGRGAKHCMSFGVPSESLSDPRTCLAVRFALSILHDPAHIPESTWTELKNQFSEAELVELVFIICQYIAVHLFGFLFDVDVPGQVFNIAE